MEAHGVGSDKRFWRDNRVWVPLADLCLTLAPDLCAPWPNRFLNQSFGLTADQAAKLADRLEELITNGSVQKYMDEAPEYEVHWPMPPGEKPLWPTCWTVRPPREPR
jgi:hypothetical protein